ncbi:hypothetical protein [Noviherbaspirillum sp. UKPF54]|uniref:hypothetical protein n=1 Tax=Noviherbaspirillum sp. UKPF54 TaxID=2601898 RepID=UPI0011B195E9|nr:hypothetical protein [Noviherbaspirillum sp. UKPF54]QDZ29941.1 hypothetical protein FAY22_19430 [Noviherbaspirillum sp. UKPF54]
MQHAACSSAIRLLCCIGITLLTVTARAQVSEFANAAECRMHWDDEFASYARQYKACGPECLSSETRRHEYLRYSDWLNRLEQWHEFCRAMNSTELQLREREAAAAWRISLRAEGQSSCELIRSGEVKFRFQWKEKGGKRCYSNSGMHKRAAACC